MALYRTVYSGGGFVLDAWRRRWKWMIPIAEKDLEVVLYDVSKRMLDVARRKIAEKYLEKHG